MAGKKLDDRLNIFFPSERRHLNSGTLFRMIEILTFFHYLPHNHKY